MRNEEVNSQRMIKQIFVIHVRKKFLQSHLTAESLHRYQTEGYQSNHCENNDQE